MATKRNTVIQDEMRSLMPYFLAVNGVYFAVLLILFFAGGFDYTLLVGGVYGNIICVLNFYLLGRSAVHSLTLKAKSAQNYMNIMYCLRYLGIFASMTAAALLPFISLIAALIPLFFTKLSITIRTLIKKEE